MVMRITRLKSASGAAEYYGYDDYYVTGEASAPELEWGGKGAEILELDGPVDKEAFKAFLEGWNIDRDGPSLGKTDDRLRREEEASSPKEEDRGEAQPQKDEKADKETDKKLSETTKDEISSDKTIGDTRQEPNQDVTGKETKQRAEHQPGWDITFSAPKGLSQMIVALGREDLRQVHDEAVLKTMSFLEQNLTGTRLRDSDGNIKHEKTDNLTWAMAKHDLSRAKEADIHNHVIVFNFTQDKDGKFRALETKDIYKYQELGTLIYHAYLRDGLAEKKIDTIDHPQRQGLVEVAGFSRESILEVSSRRNTIVGFIKDAVERLGRPLTGAEKNDRITYLDRPSKAGTDRETIMENIRQKAEELGHTKIDFSSMTGQKITMANEGSIDKVQRQIDQKTEYVKPLTHDVEKAAQHGIDSVGTKTATFTMPDIALAAMKTTRGMFTVDEVLNTKAIKQGELLKADRYDEGRLTTRSHVEAEQNVMDHLFKSRGQATAYEPEQIRSLITRERLDKTIGVGKDLNDGQYNAIIQTFASKDGLMALQGYAGTGKTTGVYQLVAEIYKDLNPKGEVMVISGREKEDTDASGVKGIGPTHTSVDELNKVGVKAQTITSLLNKVEFSKSDSGMRKGILEELSKEMRGKLLIVDEASLIDTPQMVSILEATSILGVYKVSLSGDKNQLAAHGAGAMFRLVQKAQAETTHLPTIVRQQNPLDRAAIKSLADGQITKAFSMISDKIIEVKDDHDQTKSLAIAAYREWKAGNREATLIVTTHKMGNEINQLVRNDLITRGEISGKSYTQTVYRDKNLDSVERQTTAYIRQGDHLIFHASQKSLGIEAGDNHRVLGVDHQTGRIYAERTSDLEQGSYLISDLQKNNRPTFGVFYREEIKIAKGETMVWSRSQPDLGIKAGDRFKIKEINERSVTYVDDKGKAGRIRRDNLTFQQTRHGYSMTTYQAQGKTEGHVIAVMPTQGGDFISQAQAYVALSRHKHSVSLFTNDKTTLQRQVTENDGQKSNALQHLNDPRVTKSIGQIDAESRALAKGEVLDKPERLSRGKSTFAHGQIIETGIKPYYKSKGGENTPYVFIKPKEGKPLTLWGKEVVASLHAASVALGDTVSVEKNQVVKSAAGKSINVGQLIEHGDAPYKFEDKAVKSYYVSILTSVGTKTIWGIELKDQMKAANFNLADKIVIEHKGRVKTKITEAVWDDDKKAKVEIEKDVIKNSFSIKRFEELSKDQREKLDKTPWKVDLWERSQRPDRARNLIQEIGELSIQRRKSLEGPSMSRGEILAPTVKIVREM